MHVYVSDSYMYIVMTWLGVEIENMNPYEVSASEKKAWVPHHCSTSCWASMCFSITLYVTIVHD